MEILLDDDVTASGKCGVLFSDERGFDRLLPLGILRPIDEADEVATIEVAEPMHLVHGGDGGSKAGHDVRRKLEAQVHSLRSDVEEQVAWRRDGVPFSRVNLPKRSQLRGLRRSEEGVPGIGPKRHDAGKAAVKLAKSRRADEPAQVSTEMSDCRPILHAWMNRNHEEDCRAGQRGGDRLWNRFLVANSLPPAVDIVIEGNTIPLRGEPPRN